MPVLRKPDNLSPDEFRAELARILAAGFLRLRKLRRLCDGPDESTPDSRTAGLDDGQKSVLSGGNG